MESLESKLHEVVELINEAINTSVDEKIKEFTKIEEYIPISKVCEILNVKRHYLVNRRLEGAHVEGIHYIRLGSRSIRYKSSQLENL